MKIRNFIRGGIALVLATALCFTTTGCISQATLASLTATLGTAASNVAKIEGNTDLSTKLETDTNAAVAAIKNWKSGTPADEAIEALAIVEDDLNLFPGTDQYAPLIDLAIGTAQTLIALLPVPTANGTLTAHAHRQVYLGHAAPKSSKEFKKQWNAIASSNPALASAAIK